MSRSALRYGWGRRCPPPLPELDELCQLIGLDPDGAAAVHSAVNGRWTLAFTEGGKPAAVVKLGLDADAGVEHERQALQRLQAHNWGVTTPLVRWHGRWADRQGLATAAIATDPHSGDAGVEDVAKVCERLATGDADLGFVVHGDLGPWNVLCTPTGLALVDWEECRFEFDPLFDLAHHVTLTGALLGAHDAPRAVALLIGPGSPGVRYLERIGMAPGDAPELLRSYLRRADDPARDLSNERLEQRFRASMLGVLERHR